MRPVQYFSKEYLERSSALKPEQALKFLEEFQLLHHGVKASKSRLISMKIPEAMLQALKSKAQLEGVPYQTQIKRLIEQWLK